jgi:hypothetical protein
MTIWETIATKRLLGGEVAWTTRFYDYYRWYMLDPQHSKCNVSSPSRNRKIMYHFDTMEYLSKAHEGFSLE